MKKVFFLLLATLALVLIITSALILIPPKSPPLVMKAGPFAIEHVSIVNVQDGTLSHDRTVFVDAGRIVNILPAKDYLHAAGYASIDGTGKFLIPGLWDMHTHGLKISPQIHHPLFIANGVTGVRDLSGCMDRADNYWACISDREQWTQEALAADRVSPRYILQSSYQTNGGNEVPDGFTSFFTLQDEGDAEDLVAFYKSAGADFIKVYSELTPTQYDSLVSAATDAGVDIAGHKPIKISLAHALAAGQKSIEHGRLFMFDCYEEIEAFRALGDPIRHYDTAFMSQMLAAQNEQVCADLMSAMAASQTWWVPTLTTLKMSAYANDGAFRDDSRLASIPFIVRGLIWFPDADRAAERGLDDSGNYVPREFYERALEQVHQANQLGVKLLAGTDAGDTYVFAGSSLHDELAMFVGAGLTPLAALQAATISAARFSGLESSFGTVEVGKAADIVLLNSNPLSDIANTKDIHGVFLNGHYFDKAAIDSLVVFAQDQASSIKINVRYLWDALSSPLMRKQLAD